ncbi:MAG TPA: hypothetical protein VNV66_04100 [Pilimelia sp.]|nr:hypothetical protein [Pilimelia sp.]
MLTGDGRTAVPLPQPPPADPDSPRGVEVAGVTDGGVVVGMRPGSATSTISAVDDRAVTWDCG